MAYLESQNHAGIVLYWITFAIMFASAIGVAIVTFTKPMTERKHCYCTVAILAIASTAYYAMATYGGQTPIQQYNHPQTLRAVFYARYVDWTFTTPLLLLDILLYAAVPVGITLWIMFVDIAMIILGLLGALTDSGAKWGYFAVACFFQLCIVYGLFVPALRSAYLRGKQIGNVYAGLAVYLSIAWLGYPIVWGLAEGYDVITSDAEIAAYALLDIFTKVVFGWAVVATTYMLAGPLREEMSRGLYSPDLLTAPTNAPLSVLRGNAPGNLEAGYGGANNGVATTRVGNKRTDDIGLANRGGHPIEGATGTTTTA